MLESGQRAELANGMKTDAYGFFFEEMKRPAYENPLYRKLFNVVKPSTGDEGTINSATMDVNFKETAYGEAFESGTAVDGRRHPYKLKRYSSKRGFDRALIDSDSSKEQVSNAIRVWVQSAVKKMMTTKEAKAHQIFNFGGYTAGHSVFNNSGRDFADTDLLYDGIELFNLVGNPRTMLKGPDSGITNSFYNSLGTSGVALDATNFNTAYTLMTGTNIYGEDGAPDPFIPNCLLVHPGKWFDARQIESTQTGAPGDVNNSFNPWNGLVEVIPSPFLTQTNAWILFGKTNLWEAIEDEPIINTWFDYDTDQYMVSMVWRFTLRVMTYRNCVGANLPTS